MSVAIESRPGAPLASVMPQMIGADFLKLRKRRGTIAWSLLLVLAPLLIYFIVSAAQHSSNPAEHSPAGGLNGLQDGLRILAVIFGPLAAILIGTDAGAGDVSAGVFRDLVVTGRSRLALFASRVPAAIAFSWLVALIGYAVLAIGVYALADGAPTPSASAMLNGLGFTLLSTGAIAAVAVGFSSLTASKPAALVVLIGWQLVASPILTNISSLGSARKLVLREAIDHFSPVGLGDGHGPGSQTVTLSLGTAVVVTAVWLAVFLALGAWRTRTMDA
jgi:ABC-type transport system involved in multi-copper enzyme maturation permease subunit